MEVRFSVLHTMVIRMALMVLLLFSSFTTLQAQWQTNGNALSGGESLGSTNNYPLRIRTNDTLRWTITKEGNLLQYGSNSSYAIGLWGVESVYTHYLAGPFSLRGENKGFIVGENYGSAELRQMDYAPMIFFTDDTMRLYISGNGNIGIGVLPSARLDVNGTLRFRYGAHDGYVLKSDASGNATWQPLSDDDSTNELQTLSYDTVNHKLALSNGGGTVDIKVLTPWMQYQENLYYTTGKVGIGIKPEALFHIHKGTYDDNRIEVNSKPRSSIQISQSAAVQYSTAVFLLTNKISGNTINDGLKIEATSNNAIFNLQEAGYMRFMTNKTERMTIAPNGNVGIGTTNPKHELEVKGTIRCKHFKVDVNAGADYVFDNNYKLMSLAKLENYVKLHKHLPMIPSETEMKDKGMDVEKMNILLLQKVEELTLYIIEQNKRIEEQDRKITELEKFIK